jgi:hypothetical protein
MGKMNKSKEIRIKIEKGNVFTTFMLFISLSHLSTLRNNLFMTLLMKQALTHGRTEPYIGN